MKCLCALLISLALATSASGQVCCGPDLTPTPLNPDQYQTQKGAEAAPGEAVAAPSCRSMGCKPGKYSCPSSDTCYQDPADARRDCGSLVYRQCD